MTFNGPLLPAKVRANTQWHANFVGPDDSPDVGSLAAAAAAVAAAAAEAFVPAAAA